MQRDGREPREGQRRGFVIHQKVVLEIDFSGTLFGYTEITIIPTSKELRTIHLHSKQCAIHNVEVSGQSADYVQLDPFVNLNVSNPKDGHIHPEVKRRLYSAYAEADEAELSIAIPRQVPLVLNTESASRSGTPADQGTSAIPNAGEFSPITVKVEYSMHKPFDGVEFVVPTDAYPHRVPHAYTTPSSPDAARCWVPCLDNMADKCTWEFQFVVPRYLEEGDEFGEDTGSYPTVVICSGDFGEQVSHPSQSNKTIFLFSHSAATSIQQISWAAGPFHVYPIPTEHLDDSAASQPLMHAFCLPGHEAQLMSSVTFLRSAMNFFMTDLGSYPFNSHKLVFVDELPMQRFDTSTMSLVTVDLLHGEDAIDQVYETRLSLTHALACQWVGINIQAKTSSDTWLTNGLGLYVASLFIRKLFGANEHRYRIKKDMDRVLEWDNGNMPPICQPQNLDPPEGSILSFVNIKAPLVLHILDRRLCKSGTSLGLSRVLPKLFLQAMSGEMANNALSTHAFLRLCRKVSGMDPRTFAEQWIYGSGFPSFQFNASFNRKKMAVEILMRQDCPAYKMHENDELGKALFKPVQFFEGQMTIRIHEADGTPYEHVLDIRQPFKRFEVPFNTKYKRVRRNTKRYMARQAAAQAAVDGEEPPTSGPVPGELVDVGFAVEIWDNERERDNWKISEWSEEDDARMASATYEWIRLDVDLEWITAIAFEQPDYMWVSQLQRDRDVVAQLEAVQALKRQPTAIISSVLVKTVLVSKYFHRIRCEAALALSSCAIPKLDYLGLFHLFKLFLRHCFEPEDPRQDLFTHTYVPRTNDFTDIAEYFVRKSLVNALSRVRFDNGKTPSIIRQFLIDQLRFNDNTSNPYSDAYYICTIITALAAATVPTKPPERNEIVMTEIKVDHTPEDIKLLNQALGEIDRYRSMDRLIPSTHNVVTIAAIEFYLVLSMADLVPNDPRTFFPLTREGNYHQVRMAAFDALFLTKWYTPKMMRYFFAVMAHDSSRMIRRHIARNACHSLALLYTMGEFKANSKDNDNLLIEEDGSVPPEKMKDAKKSEVDLMIRALRKDRELGKGEVLREFLMPLVMAPDVDHEVRWHLLKLGDVILRGADEAPPKVTIFIPPTPVVEQAPPVLLLNKPSKRDKIKNESTVRSPLTPIAPALKLTFAAGTPTTPKVSQSVPKTPRVSIAPSQAKPIRPKEPKMAPPPPPTPALAPTPVKVQRVDVYKLHKACGRKTMELVMADKHASIFLQPVDPIRDSAPNYFEVIREPMDLSTMRAKLDANKYKYIDELAADFRLMIANCKHYNSDGSYAFMEAQALEQVFNKQLARMQRTINTQLDRESELLSKAKSEGKANSDKAMGPPAIVPAPNPSTPTPARPSITLKLGGDKPKVKPIRPASPVAGPTPRPKKAKTNEDSPPPPYVDDGSHDLLQEVIAIENARDEKRTSGSLKISVGKRKRSSTTITDDGATAEVHKRERHSPSASQSSAPDPTPATPKPKLILAPLKAKKPVEPSTPSAAAMPVPPVAPAPHPPSIAPSPVPSAKGKDRERSQSSSAPTETPSKTKRSSESAGTPVDVKKAKEVIKTLLRLPEAMIFQRPVDPELDGCPTYYDEIKHPMDLGTMQTKLSQGKYRTMEEVAADYRLMIGNCRAFNPPQTYPTQCADVLDATFQKEWGAVMEKKLLYGEKRSLQAVLNKLTMEPQAWLFLEPVDPVALGIPTYHDIVPKKEARDLRTIRQKLDADKYPTVDALEADLELMINNATKFNGAESEVGAISIQFRNRIRETLAGANLTSAKKRKEGGGSGTPQPGAKKIKLV